MFKLIALAVAISMATGPVLAQTAKPVAPYTINTVMTGYTLATDKYAAQVRISANPCPGSVTYDNTIFVSAKDAGDALVQAQSQLAKIEQDIQESAAKCAAH